MLGVNDNTINLQMFGGRGVGKTCFLTQFINGEAFPPNWQFEPSKDDEEIAFTEKDDFTRASYYANKKMTVGSTEYMVKLTDGAVGDQNSLV